MPRYAVIVEQAEDTTWSAYSVTPAAVAGTGATRDEALEDFRVAMTYWLEHLKETGQAVPSGGPEVVSLEVAA